MSARVMTVLESFAPSLEIYSIDEAFLDLTGVCHANSNDYAQQIKKTVQRYTGIPVCVGMAPTKTLAKLANYAAKKWPHTGGVLDLSDPIRREKLMKLVAVKEVWGVGSRTAARLEKLGILKVWDLANQPAEVIQNQFNVVLARTVQELNGVACLELEEIAPDKQQIVCSRSFSRRLTDYGELSQALAEFCSRAAEKLRRQHSVASHISVFIRTSPFNANEPQYQRAASKHLLAATQDSRIIIATANNLLKEIFKAGYAYQKCGVQLSGIQPETQPNQSDLFMLDSNQAESLQLMKTIDRINRRYPKSVTLAATGLDNRWQTKRENVSPHYTTDWRELVGVNC